MQDHGSEPWFERLGAACWICGPDERIAYANPRAASLFELSGDPVGRRCSEAVRCSGAAGEPFCRGTCPVRRQLADTPSVDPVRLRVGWRGRWVDVLSAPLDDGDAGAVPLVHVAVDAERDQSALQYLERVAHRHRSPARAPRVAEAGLTTREQGILRRLAEDQDPQTIARELGIRPATTRNHVQRVLRKLGVHSIQEAVALYLLEGGGVERSSERVQRD